MSDKVEINCEELAKKMNECLEQGDNEQCKEFVEDFNKSCKKDEEKEGFLSWAFGSKDKETKGDEEQVEDKEDEKKDE